MATVALADLAEQSDALPRGSRPAKTAVHSLAELEERVRVGAPVEARVVPARPEIAALLPFGGFRRGSVVAVSRPSLLFASLAAAMAEGAWAGAVGMAALGFGAGAEHGVVLDRFVVIDQPPPAQGASVVAALIDAVELVVVGPGIVSRLADARRLCARLRERGGVLFAAGAWPDAVDVGLDVDAAHFEGLDRGHGHLRAWDLDLVVRGRHSADRGRCGHLVLAGDSAAPFPGPAAAVPDPVRRVG